MPVTLDDVVTILERRFPLDGAEEWDAPGLVVGRLTAPVRRIHLAVDAVSATVEEAISAGADVLLVHHPLLLRGVTTVAENTAKGALIADLIRGNCALYSAHTNADIVETGTSARLADLLGLVDAEPITASAPSRGLGRVGDLPEPVALSTLAERVADILPPTVTGVRFAGEPGRLIHRVAVCGGAGDSLLDHPAVRAADAYVTSDLRHHPASEALETSRVGGGPALIDTSHWASESLWLDVAAAELRDDLPGVMITVSSIPTDPWTGVVRQPAIDSLPSSSSKGSPASWH
jgi:dinuclear metal center YbgI/SA1388 family protein